MFSVRDSFIAYDFPEITPYRQRVEMPCGCWVELTMVFTHRARKIRNEKSFWWVAAYTEYALKPAASLLVEVYHIYRLWCMYPDMIRNIRRLHLVQLLRSSANEDELERLLRVI